MYNKVVNVLSLRKLVSFVFPQLYLGKHQDSQENKTNCFPHDLILIVQYSLCSLQMTFKYDQLHS